LFKEARENIKEVIVRQLAAARTNNLGNELKAIDILNLVKTLVYLKGFFTHLEKLLDLNSDPFFINWVTLVLRIQ
jgi:hypothetical protein